MIGSSLFMAILAVDRAAATNATLPTVSKCTTATFKAPMVPGAEILSVKVEEKRNASSTSVLPTVPSIQGISYCDIKVYLTHPGANDKVLVQTWLPLAHEDWNGRYQATGGRGYATGIFEVFLGPAIKAGYAASSTDGGHQGMADGLGWTLNPDRSVNWDLMQDFATRSLADMTHVGKSLAEQYFGTAPHHSYFNGCSQGGRQGYAIAQRYPELLDGILAEAPAISIANLAVGDLWPQVVMKETEILMSNCEFEWFRERAITACDLLDGVDDGIIEDPEACPFDPDMSVGKSFQCDGQEVEVTKGMAEVVRKVYEGPRTPYGAPLWYPLPLSTRTIWIANITVGDDGVRTLRPFGVSATWVQNLLLKDTSFNVSTLSYSDFRALYAQSIEQYAWLLNADNPNLVSFRNAGGKLLSWHGINDPVIPYYNTVQYRQRVEIEMGGAKAVDQFYRLFLAPGVEHCGEGTGAVPKDPLEKLVDWVEKGEPPETLEGETMNEQGELITRDLCLYPRKTKYMGIGDGKRASTWSCEGGEDDDEHFEEKVDFLNGLKERLLGLGMGLKIG